MLDKFSPNMLKTFENCEKKYYFQYIENINAPKSAIMFEKGKKIHALANYYLKGINISKIETALDDAEKEIWEDLKSNSYYQKTYHKSEYELSCKISNFIIGGRIDAIVHDDNRDYYILDYKTGSIPKHPEQDFQTIVYLLCLDKHLKNYNNLSFVYIDLKNKKNCEIRFTNELKDIYTKKIIKICEKIESKKVYSKNTQNCKYCEYKKFCF